MSKGDGTERAVPANLAIQIRDSVCKQIPIAPLMQEGDIRLCRGPEEIYDTFLDGLSQYPPSIMRLPMTVALVEISNYYELIAQGSKRKVKRVLKRLAPAVRNSVRDADIVVRYGRNKFAVLLIGSDEDLAARICMRMKEAVLRYCYFRLGLKKQFYLDFTISEYRPRSGEDLAEVIFSADRNMRLARNFGNGVIIRASEAQKRFRHHKRSDFVIGEPCTPDYVIHEER